MKKRQLLAPLVLAALLGPGVGQAQGVAFAGRMGDRALLVIDGRTQMLRAGEQAGGVKLLALQPGQAQVERAGIAAWVREGAAPVSLGAAAAPSGGREIVLASGPGGHFMGAGAINGRAVRFLVDTGASVVALGRDEADRIGLDYRTGERVVLQTANGAALGWRTTIASLRVGEVEVAHVPALVAPAPLPYVLLGNSFLGRFQMRRDNDVMRLELR